MVIGMVIFVNIVLLSVVVFFLLVFMFVLDEVGWYLKMCFVSMFMSGGVKEVNIDLKYLFMVYIVVFVFFGMIFVKIGL